MSWMQCILQWLFIYLLHTTVTLYIPSTSLRVTIKSNSIEWIPHPRKNHESGNYMPKAPGLRSGFVWPSSAYFETNGRGLDKPTTFPLGPPLFSLTGLFFSQWMALTGVGALLKLLPCLIEGRQSILFYWVSCDSTLIMWSRNSLEQILSYCSIFGSWREEIKARARATLQSNEIFSTSGIRSYNHCIKKRRDGSIDQSHT